MPTVPMGGHGLGRLAIDMARALQRLGHEVTLYAGLRSVWEGKIVIHADEITRASQLDFDADAVWIDLSHHHALGQTQPDWPVLHYIVDTECDYVPPNAAVANPCQFELFPAAQLLHIGIDVDKVALNLHDSRSYYTYCAKIVWHKGYQVVERIAPLLPHPTVFVGAKLEDVDVPNWKGEIRGDKALHHHLGQARALISPTLMGLGARCALEAAACGTPTIALDVPASGMNAHVIDGVTGYVVPNEDEALVAAVLEAESLDKRAMRDYIDQHFSLKSCAMNTETLLTRLLDGERW